MTARSSPPEVRTAVSDDLDALGPVVARAFADDPVWRHLVRRRDRWKAAPSFFAATLGHPVDRAEVFTTAGWEGAAVWAAPGRWKVKPTEEAAVAVPAVRLFGPGLVRAVRFLAALEKVHPPEPHWYLAILATDPAHQGRGIGSALLAPVLDRCDSEGLPAYLESTRESTVAFYARHGFTVTEPLTIADGPTLYPMWREPSG